MGSWTNEKVSHLATAAQGRFPSTALVRREPELIISMTTAANQGEPVVIKWRGGRIKRDIASLFFSGSTAAHLPLSRQNPVSSSLSLDAATVIGFLDRATVAVSNSSPIRAVATRSGD